MNLNKIQQESGAQSGAAPLCCGAAPGAHFESIEINVNDDIKKVSCFVLCRGSMLWSGR
jgi:hypothetical protein